MLLLIYVYRQISIAFLTVSGVDVNNFIMKENQEKICPLYSLFFHKKAPSCGGA